MILVKRQSALQSLKYLLKQALLYFVSKCPSFSQLTRQLDSLSSRDKWNPTPAADLRYDCCSAHCYIVQSKNKIKKTLWC